MLRQITELEYVHEGRVCRLTCNSDMSTVIIKDAISQFLKYIEQVENVISQQKQEEAKEGI